LSACLALNGALDGATDGNWSTDFTNFHEFFLKSCLLITIIVNSRNLWSILKYTVGRFFEEGLGGEGGEESFLAPSRPSKAGQARLDGQNNQIIISPA
jgi:hypothetical protein